MNQVYTQEPMPIVHSVESQSSLTQGDILHECVVGFFNSEGRAHIDHHAQYLLVVSRPCKAVRDHLIVVAPIRQCPIDFTKIIKDHNEAPACLEHMRRFFAGIRDGARTFEFSDSFYLGDFDSLRTPKEGLNTRYAADLTLLSTIQIPGSETSHERAEWIRNHRIGRLQIEFLRDLHLRIFTTFSRLGFEDVSWLSDVDLEIMITAAEHDIHYYEQKLNKEKQAIQTKEALNQNVSDQQRKQLQMTEESSMRAKAYSVPYYEEKTKRMSRLIGQLKKDSTP